MLPIYQAMGSRAMEASQSTSKFGTTDSPDCIPHTWHSLARCSIIPLILSVSAFYPHNQQSLNYLHSNTHLLVPTLGTS